MLIAMRTLSPSIVPPLSRFPSSQSIQSISKLLASPCNRRDIFTISTGAFRKKGGEKKLTSFARKVSVGARLFRNRVGDLNNLAASRTPLRFPTPVMLSFEPLPSSRVNNLSPIFPTLFLAYIIIWSRIDTIFRNNFSKQTD